MKKYLVVFLLSPLLLLTSCQKSNEDKARELIKQYIKENANDPDSYEAVEFEKLDTQYTSWLHTPEYEKAESYRDRFLNERSVDFKTSTPEMRYQILDSLNNVIDELRNAHEPEPIGYMMRHKFRANNAFGAKVLQKKVFRFDLDITEVTSSDNTLD